VQEVSKQNHVVNINESNAKELLIDESFKRPVVIDFWADWCGPCKSLMPILEKLAAEYGGDFLLAKVNADEQQMLAAQFGVRSLPTVLVMQNGQPVDGFAGAQSEVQVRELLEKYLPKPWDDLLVQGKALLEQGNASEALSILREAYVSSEKRPDIACALADAMIRALRYDEAEQILNDVRFVDQDAYHEQLVAQLELARQASKAPEITALEAEYAADPENLDVAYRLALQYQQHQYMREALELLYGILRKDMNFGEGAAKKTLMDTLAVLGKGDPLAVEFQRKVYTLLY
jgi:putative thioredoxin